MGSFGPETSGGGQPCGRNDGLKGRIDPEQVLQIENYHFSIDKIESNDRNLSKSPLLLTNRGHIA